MSRLMPEWQRSDVLAAVFDKLTDAIVLYDRNLVITGVNRAAERLFEMSADDMVGNSCRSVFRCGTCESACGMLLGMNMETVPNCTVRLHTASGTERLAIIRTTQLRN